MYLVCYRFTKEQILLNNSANITATAITLSMISYKDITKPRYFSYIFREVILCLCDL